MVTSVAPLHFEASRIQPDSWFMQDEYMTVPTVLGTFAQNSHAATRLATLLIDGMVVRSREIGERWDNTITRLELFWYEQSPFVSDRRGLIMYTATGRAQMHIVHALAGYGGSGPALTEAVFRHLGISQDVFDSLNTAVATRNYHVIVSREPIEVIDGVEAVVPRTAPADTWRWWPAPPS